MVHPTVRPPGPPPLISGLVVLALVGCFDDPPMVDDTSESTDPSTGTGTSAGPTTSSSTTIPDTGSGSTANGSSGPGTTTLPDDSSGPPDTGSSETGPMECDAEDGLPDPACESSTPFCVGGACVPCSGGGNCGAIDPATPVCGADDVCRPCQTQYECPGNAGCHLFEGTCLPPDNVYYVDPTTMCGPGEASEANPACTIAEALSAGGLFSEKTIRLVEEVYFEPVVIGGGEVVVITAEGASTLAANSGTATVLNGGTLYLATIDVQNFSFLEPGIQSSGDLWLDDMLVRNNEIGILSTGGRVVLRRSRVLDSPGVGMVLQGSDPVTLVNSIVAGGGFDTDPGGIVTEGPAPLDILYSTIVSNSGNVGGAIDCGPGSVTVRNSIITSNSLSNAIDCGPGSSVTYSAISDAAFDGDPTNVGVMNFGDLNMDANYEIGPGSVAIDVALWERGDPPTDINGTLRPDVGGSPDDAGADRSIE